MLDFFVLSCSTSMFAFLQNLQLASPQKKAIFFPDHNNIDLEAQSNISYLQFLASKKNKEVQVFFLYGDFSFNNFCCQYFFSLLLVSLCPKCCFARSCELFIMYFVTLLNKARCCAAVKSLIQQFSPLFNITSNR